VAVLLSLLLAAIWSFRRQRAQQPQSQMLPAAAGDHTSVMMTVLLEVLNIFVTLARGWVGELIYRIKPCG